MSGILYCVAVPIGNPGDITSRAVDTLRMVDIIACENTNKLKDLLKRAGIETQARFLAYYSYNEQESAKGLLAKLLEGQSIALVTAAGTPRISDPGYHLVRGAYENDIRVTPVPGPAAFATAMSIAPIPVDPFLFLGFISPKPGKRDNTLAKYDNFEGTVCFYESIHRIQKLLMAILAKWGDLECFIARELTKQHENLFWGSLSEAIDWVSQKKGEFVLLVHKKDSINQ